MNSDLLFLASLIVASLLGVPPCCVGKPRQNLGYAYVFRLASRKNSGVIFSQILSCQTITVNTDFAQADVDRQVVNLNRFSVFFPERRQFFLENANIFNASVTNWIRPFFSRRIGLDESGNPIPIDGGLRLTQQTAKQQIGVLGMRQRAGARDPASYFGVLRYSRNLSGQSRLGGMLTYRHDEAIQENGTSQSATNNYTYTIDGLTQAFYQRNTSVKRNVWNVRFSWEYRPLSYIYLVFNRNALDNERAPDRFSQQQYIGKITYLLQL